MCEFCNKPEEHIYALEADKERRYELEHENAASLRQ